MKKGLLSGFIGVICAGLLSLAVSSSALAQSQTLTITSVSTTIVDDILVTAVTTTATDGGGALSYTITYGTGAALVDGNGIIAAIQAGTVTLTVNSSGNTNYSPASVDQLITIGMATPTLTITSDNTIVLGGSLNAIATTTATFGRGGNITFSISAGSGSATVDSNTGLINTISAGTVTLTAMSAGDADYNPATANQLITISGTTPTLTITSANTIVIDGTLTATVTTTATTSSGGAITFSISAGSGSATVNSTTGLITAIGAGTVTLTATSAGDTNYYAATTSQLITISKGTPTLVMTSASTMTIGTSITATVTTSATGGRGGAITFAVIGGSGSATVNPTTGLITPIGIGTITLTITSAGDTDYSLATTSQLITIGQGAQNLTIISANNLLVDGTLTVTITTTATPSQGGTLSYTIINGTGTATVDSNGLITGVNAGTVTLTVISSGDTNYSGASTSQLITIYKTTPTLMYTAATTVLENGSLTITVTNTAGNRGGPFSFVITNGSGSATVSNDVITGVYAGAVTLIVTTLGDADYYSATISQTITVQTININRTTPTITITSDNTVLVDGFLVISGTSTAINGGGGVIGFAITAGSGSATVDTNGIITGISVGTVTLTVTSAGDADYYSATTSQLITVGKGSQTLTVTSPNTIALDGAMTASVTTTATGGRGGTTFSYSIINGTGIATVDPSGHITAIQKGTFTLTVTSAGDTDYNGATTSQLITVGKGSQTLTVTSANTVRVDGTLTATVSTTATGGRGGALSFAISAGSGSATVNVNTGLITGVDVGTVTLTVTSAGDSDFLSASASQLITIGRTTPIFTITSANTMIVGGTLSISGTSTARPGLGGSVNNFAISAGSGSATVDTNGLITAISAGTITLTAISTGDSDYYPAVGNQLITIGKATPTLTTTSANTLAVGGTLTATITTTAIGGGAFSYSISGGSGSATVDPTTGLISAVSAGTVTLTSTSAGDANYNGATVSQLITITGGSQTLTVTSASIMTVDGSLTASVTTTATFGRGGTWSYGIVNATGIATVNPITGLITAIGVGEVTLTVASSGDADYNPATTQQLITIGKATPVLTVTSSSLILLNTSLTATVSTTATFGRGGIFSYNISGGSGSATVDSNGLISATAVGSVTLVVTSSGDTNYNPATTNQGISIATLSISNSATLAEGQTGAFVISLVPSDSTLSSAIAFTISSASGSIANASHYTLPSTVVFPAGQNSVSVPVQALADQILYNDELLMVNFTNPSFGTLTGTLTITDRTALNPSNLKITIGDAKIYQSGTVPITVSLPAGVTSAVPIDIALGVRIDDKTPGSYTFPIMVTIPANSNMASFDVSADSTAEEDKILIITGAATSSLSNTTYTVLDGKVVVIGQQMDVERGFSPNGDGIGDSFQINNITNYPDNIVSIVNTSGVLIYQGIGYNNDLVAFKGLKPDGTPLSPGNYYIYVLYDDKSGKPQIHVNFLVLKNGQ